MKRLALTLALPALMGAAPTLVGPPLPPSPAPVSPTLAIAGATLIDAAGEQRKGMTVLMAGDRILSVGKQAAPAGVPTIDGRGGWVSAGLFDAACHLGLAEVGLDDVSRDHVGGDERRPIAAGVRVADGFDPHLTTIPVTRIEGVTTAAIVPAGGLIAGQGAVVELYDARGAARVVVPSVGLFGTVAPYEADLPGTAGRPRLMSVLRELFALGKAPAIAPAELIGRLPWGMGLLDYQAVRDMASGKTPLFLQAHRASDILAAIRLTREHRVPLVLMGAEEAWMVAGAIAAAKAPVVLDPLANLPDSFDRRASRLENAALLHRAGVRVAFGTWNGHDSRRLRQKAGVAVANGLPWAAAWRALTVEPAAIYGLAASHGALAPGRAANAVLWGGDPFEPATEVRAVVIGGRQVPLDSRQEALARRYRQLPPR